MAQIYLYDQDKKIIGEPMDSVTCPLGWLLGILKENAKDKQPIDVVIEECFNSENTYYNIHFAPNKLRIIKVGE